MTDRVSAIRVGTKLLREWDDLDALIGGYSTAQLQMQKLFLFQDSESQVRPSDSRHPSCVHVINNSARTQVATIGLGNDQRFENYRSLYPRYTSIQGSVVQTLKVR
jgi:hypothetical protein